jgi:NhaC family Na+:H+ antiporter
MWTTTLPSFVITFVVFCVIGASYQGTEVNMDTITLFTDALAEHFKISPILLIPMIVLLILNAIRFPAVPGMAIGSLLAVLLAVFVQGVPLAEVIEGLNYGYVRTTGVEIVDTLLCRGGIQNMMYTFSLSCIAISFGGVMEHVGYLRKIVAVIISHIKKDALLVPIVILSTTIGTLTMGEVYLSIVVNGNLYRETFKKRGLRPEMLSRLLEEGGTLTQCFIPWSTTGVFILGTLGVGAGEYWKYAVLNYVNPILSIVLAIFGFGILHAETEKNSL